MAENESPKDKKGGKPAETREDRLAAALRDNLKRRKAQTRAQTAQSVPPAPKPPKSGENR